MRIHMLNIQMHLHLLTSLVCAATRIPLGKAPSTNVCINDNAINTTNNKHLWRIYPQEPELRGATNQNH